MVRRIYPPCLLLVWLLLPTAGQAAIWKGTGEISHIHFDVELNDAREPVQIFIRVENTSKLESIKITRNFVQITNSDNDLARPVAADELVSDYLERLRELLPQHSAEINSILGEIRADFPQEKIVEVYARLKEYMQRGRPNTWRTNLENFLLGKQYAKSSDITAANALIEEIGSLAKNYFWPNDLPPQGIQTGMLFFQRPTKLPPRIYLQIGDQFVGTALQMSASDEKGKGGIKHGP